MEQRERERETDIYVSVFVCLHNGVFAITKRVDLITLEEGEREINRWFNFRER